VLIGAEHIPGGALSVSWLASPNQSGCLGRDVPRSGLTWTVVLVEGGVAVAGPLSLEAAVEHINEVEVVAPNEIRNPCLVTVTFSPCFSKLSTASDI
jgi:hypothetical protein